MWPIKEKEKVAKPYSLYLAVYMHRYGSLFNINPSVHSEVPLETLYYFKCCIGIEKGKLKNRENYIDKAPLKTLTQNL